MVNKTRKNRLQKSFIGLLKRGSEKVPSALSGEFTGRNTFNSSLDVLVKKGRGRKKDSDEEDDPPVCLEDF